MITCRSSQIWMCCDSPVLMLSQEFSALKIKGESRRVESSSGNSGGVMERVSCTLATGVNPHCFARKSVQGSQSFLTYLWLAQSFLESNCVDEVPEDASEVWFGNRKVILQNQFKDWFVNGFIQGCENYTYFSQDAEPEKDGFIYPYTHTPRYVLFWVTLLKTVAIPTAAAQFQWAGAVPVSDRCTMMLCWGSRWHIWLK